MFNKKVFQNGVWIILVVIFGFSSVFNLFSNKNVRFTIGKEKITNKDLFELGGRDEKTFRLALQFMAEIAYIKNAFDDMGFVLSDKKIENQTKLTFSRNGEFNAKTMSEYMEKHNISKNGLAKIISNELRKMQVFFPYASVKISDKFVDKLHKGLTRSRAGYCLQIDLDSISPKDLIKYANPTKSELIDFCLKNPQVASKECYIFYTDNDTGSLSLEEMKKKFEYEQTSLKTIGTSSLNNQKIRSNEMDCQVPFNIDKFNKKSLRTSVESINGKKYFIYYNPIKDLRTLLDKLADDLNFGEFAARKIGLMIKQKFEKPGSNQQHFLEHYNFEGNKFKFSGYTSFKDSFQKKKTNHSSSNDCTCGNCFNPDNSNKLTRPMAISLIFGNLNKAHLYVKGKYLLVTIPREESTDSGIDKRQVHEELNQSASGDFSRAAMLDLQESSISMT